MNYYAVQRSDDFLMHYGVKGMKWGVRKRTVLVGEKSPGYLHAEKKLMNLSRKENREIQKVQKAQARGQARKVKRLYNKASEKMEQLRDNANLDYQRGQNSQMKEDQSRMFWWSDNSGRIGGLGLKKNAAVRIMNRLDGRKSKKLMSGKGHAKAVKQRDDYEKQMQRMFAGTKYASNTSKKRKLK